MKATYEEVAAKWGALAESTYNAAVSLGEDEPRVRGVYQRFKTEEEELFAGAGWTYDEFRAETLSRTLEGQPTDEKDSSTPTP